MALDLLQYEIRTNRRTVQSGLSDHPAQPGNLFLQVTFPEAFADDEYGLTWAIASAEPLAVTGVSRDDGSRFTLSFQSAPALPFSLGWVAVGNLSGGVASPAVSIELSAGKRVLLSGHSAVVPPGADSVTVPLDIALADGGYAVVWSLAGPDAPAVQSVERTPSAFTLTFVAETTEPLVVWWQVHGELT